MSRSKVTPEQRIEAALSYVNVEGSYNFIAVRYSVEQTRIKVWVRQYKANGPWAFKEQQHNTVYAPELKANAVLDYLAGNGSIQTIAAKYGLRSPQTLEKLVHVKRTKKYGKSTPFCKINSTIKTYRLDSYFLSYYPKDI